jgi:methionyl-tRNA synthetase
VWFEAVIGYLSAAREWAQRQGQPEAWRAFWQDPAIKSYYFLGKDNIVFHAEIWPALLMGYSGRGDKGGTPGKLGALNLPTEIVSSEFLTMEAQKFSASRGVGILVRDFLSRYDADALRYYLCVAGPETSDTDFTWAEFLRRNNDELLAGWGNLVNRSVSMAAKNFGAIPPASELTDADRDLLVTTKGGYATVGDLLGSSRQKAALGEAMRVVAATNKYFSEQAPWKLRESDPERFGTILHIALQAVDDCKTLLTPFLPHSSDAVHRLLGNEETWSGMSELRKVSQEGGPDYNVLMGDYGKAAARWESRPLVAGTRLAVPTPVFKKLDQSVVDEELARLAESGGATS